MKVAAVAHQTEKAIAMYLNRRCDTSFRWDFQRYSQGFEFGWDFWRNSLELAKTFGWLPGEAFPPFDHGRNEDNPLPLSEDYREVSDADARALGAALYRVVVAVETGQTLSEEQQLMLAACRNVSLIRALADFAIMGSFTIA